MLIYLKLALTCIAQDYLANQLQLELDKLNNQARFVQMIVDKQLVVANRKKADIVAELRRKDFKPFPKVAKAKAAGETEEAQDDEDSSEDEGAASNANLNSSDYDYLLGMAIWSLTKEKVCHQGFSKRLLFDTSSRSRNYSSKRRRRSWSCSLSLLSRPSRFGKRISMHSWHSGR